MSAIGTLQTLTPTLSMSALRGETDTPASASYVRNDPKRTYGPDASAKRLFGLGRYDAARQAVERVVEMLQLPEKDPFVGNHSGRE